MAGVYYVSASLVLYNLIFTINSIQQSAMFDMESANSYYSMSTIKLCMAKTEVHIQLDLWFWLIKSTQLIRSFHITKTKTRMHPYRKCYKNCCHTLHIKYISQFLPYNKLSCHTTSYCYLFIPFPTYFFKVIILNYICYSFRHYVLWYPSHQ